MGHLVLQPAEDLKERLRQEFPGYEPDYAMPVEPGFLDELELDRVLKWASELGASDINFMTNEPITVELQGRFYRLTKRKLNSGDLEMVTNIFYGGANGVSHIRSAGEIDTSYSIRNESEGSTFLFRVNVTGCRATFGAPGIQVTIRTINGIPPTFAQLRVEQEIIDAFYPENGLVLVCGKTGSGKSTTLSAGVRYSLETGRGRYKWLLFESPTEYVYDDVYRAADMVVQHEVPRNVVSFARAVRNSLRRAPTSILIGECRDYATISAAVEAAETGHALYSTVHANSVSESVYRILNMFPQEERSSKLFEVVETLRLVVAQKLVIGVDGKRVALREYLVFDQPVRDRMRNVQTMKEAVAMVSTLVEERGQSMLKAALLEFKAGRIGKHVVESLEDATRNIVDDFDTKF